MKDITRLAEIEDVKGSKGIRKEERESERKRQNEKGRDIMRKKSRE